MKVHVFEASQWVPTPIDETFSFFADAANLDAITPAFLNFRTVPPLPVPLREGALIEHRLKLHGIPVRWKTRIDLWEPGRAFVDRQLKGPYAQWIHRHTFEPAAGGTLLRDRVEYALPLDPFSRPVHRFFVRPTVEKIFAYRRKIIAERFGGGGRESP